MATVVRGRQAEAAVNDQRVLAAAREVFASRGYDAPVSAVAEAAGVGMGSLYRRYGSKDELLAELCLRSMREMVAIAAAVRAQTPAPGHRLDSFVRGCVAARCGAFAGVAGRVPVTAEMISAARQSQHAVSTLVKSAQADGVLRGDVTVVDVLRLIELFSRAPRTPGEAGYPGAAARLLAIALGGLRPTDGPALPGSAPSLRQYRERWFPA